MIDQAEALRTLVKDKLMCCQTNARMPRVYTVAVTSGKGGVGKTSLAVNLALLLSRSGQRVRLIDADMGLSNAEVLLGVSPRHTLQDVITGRVDISDAWVDVPEGIKLLSSGSGLEAMANIDGSTGAGMIEHVLQSVSDGEVIVIDTAPGIDQSIISMLTMVTEVMMITTPEPTSITDTYAAIKVLMSYKPDADITLVANCCNNPAQAASVARGLDSICNRFLNRGFQRYEYLPSDISVMRAIQSQRPLAVYCNHSAVSSWMRRLAIKLTERIRRNMAFNVKTELVRV